MKNVFKQLPVLWLVVFSSLLWAPDSDNVSVTVTDAAPVYESSGPLKFTIQLSSAPIIGFVTVDYTTVDGTAKVGEDYTDTSNSVTFWPLQSSKTIDVPVIDNSIHESDETVNFVISTSSSGYSVTRSTGVGTIHDDDKAPLEASIEDKTVYEGDSSWSENIRVSLNQNATNDITLKYDIIDNSAIYGSDYDAKVKSATITIPNGTDNVYIPLTIIGDTTPEGSENFTINISSISEGTIVKSSSTISIIDDDAIRVNMSAEDINEGDSGDSNQMKFKIYLDKDYPLDTSMTIHYTTQDGSSTPSATAGSDYVAKSGDVVFSKGDKEKFVYVDIIGDDDIEDDEFLQMNLSGSTSIVTTQTQALILNDDGDYPSVSLDSTEFSIVEGNSSQSNLNFTFTLDKPSIAGSSFHYETYDNTAEDERGDNDYIYTHGDKNLTVGTTTFTISVPINGDTKIEEDESFYFTFLNLNNLNYGSTSTAKGTIVNDDGSYPTISFTSSDFSITEGDSGQRDINVTLSLDLPALKNSYFDYYTKDNTAIGGEDFIKIDRTTFNIAEGEQNITIPITINGDTTIENDETFYLSIDNISDNLKLSGTQSPTVTVLNDDGSFPKIDIEKSSYSTIEGNNTSHTITIKLVLDKPAVEDTTVEYYTDDLTAQDGSSSTEDNDYIGSSGTINIPENNTSATITLSINEDELIEPDENFKLYIQNAKNATIGQNSTTINILNDDEHSDEPFECDEHMYLSSSRKRGTVVTGKMWLHRIDISQSPFRFEVLDDTGEDKLYNALAYSEKDNYIYGLYHKELFRISKTAKIISLGEVSKLPDFMEDKQAFAGASYNGYYYVTGFGVDYDKIYKIKLSDDDAERTVEEITLTTAVSINDFSFSPDGKYLYGITYGGKLTKIDVNSGAVTFIGESHTGYAFDSSFSDRNGRFFANDGGGKGFFEFNLDDGTKSFLSNSQPADYNDGANCIKAELEFTDYGDAPHSAGRYYGEAWHSIVGGIYLGDKVDHDTQTYANDSATGDDTNGTDDEDGVTRVDGTPIEEGYFEDNSTQQLKVKLSKDAYLRIWIDLNIDGYFDNGHDLVYDSKLTAGEHTISINLPENLPSGITTYLRARVSSIPAMDYQGYLLDGEVEDYAIKFNSDIQSTRGAFNIERTNSGSYAINSDERNAWFTQIVGRDFDYSLVFYEEDMSAEKELDNVTVKIDLINEDTNETLYEQYAYIKNDPTKSRIDNLLSNDLDKLPATKRAIFRIHYGVTSDGSIIQGPCDTDPKTCFEALPNTTFVYAKDDFAIRPEYFHMIISDGNQTLRVNTSPDNNSSLRLTSGYDYTLAVTASIFNGTDANPAKDYNTTATRVIEFLDKSNPNAVIKDDFNTTQNFIDGKSDAQLLEVQEVGRYRLGFIDSNWAKVDSDKGDCDINSSISSANGNIKSGCNTASNPDINLTFYPDHFDVDMNIQNLPNSSHNDFIYMSEINSTFNSVAIAYQGEITAKSEDNMTTKNFVGGYMAQDTLFDLDVTTLSDSGTNQPVTTTKGTPVEFVRVIKFNNDMSVIVDRNSTFANIPTINIPKDKFENDKNGTVELDIRYNINKNLSETINPVQITFHKIDTNSTDSYSISNGRDETNPYIPKGYQNLGDTVRNFYFAQVAPDKSKFPRVHFVQTDKVRTPMQVEIFCGENATLQFCHDTNLMSHTKIESSPRAETGWYISIDHNATVDGAVNLLVPDDINPNVLQFSTVTTPTFPILFENGRNGTIITKFPDPTGTKRYRVDIFPEPPLKFYDGNKPVKLGISKGNPDYTVEGTENNDSTWTGIGKTGRVLEMKSNSESTHKMDW
ncbi:MAG: hypothetical protein GXO60_00145 [Epsilonproteobacteria bacterium]|nr:hypothetical protein [Campylobacterota bacterium]